MFWLAVAGPADALDTLEFRLQDGHAALRTALERASLLRTAQAQRVTDPLELFATARAEYGRLIGVFYEAGFYAPQISVRIDGREAAEIAPLRPPEAIDTITVEMAPGPPFSFARARIGPLADGTDLPDGFRSGAPARSTVIRDAAQAAVDRWRAVGHPQAEPAGQDITARHPRRVLDVAVTIAPGPQLAFGELVPDGQENVRRDRIIEIAGLPSGARFDPRALRRAAERLRRTGSFASVALREAEAANPDGTLDISASVVEAPPRRIGAGVEYDTERGAQLTAFWLHRNLLGGAERFRVEGMVDGIGADTGGLDYRVELDVARPATLTPDTTLSLTALAEAEDERDFDARRARADLRLTHRASDTLSYGGGIGLLAERARFGAGGGQRQDYRLLLLPLDVTWDRRDDRSRATSGTYLAAELTPFIGTGGTGVGARATADLRAYRGFGANVVLAGRTRLGVVGGPSLQRTPRDFLFYSGGGGTVRGQPYRSLGVQSGGVTSGGQGFASASVELRVRASDRIGLAAFADAGYVSAGAFSGASDWHAGAGVGLRYDTTIGPLRLDVGVPVRGTTGSGAQLYLGIGQAF